MPKLAIRPSPEVSNSSGSVVSGWTKNTKKPNFFEKRKKSSKTQKLKNVQRYAKISDTPFDQSSLIHRKRGFHHVLLGKISKKKLLFARRFQTTSKQKCSNVRPFLSITFPKGFRISKNIGHPTSGSGGKKTVKKDRKPKKTEKSKEKNFFLRGDFRQLKKKKMSISETTSFHYFSPRIPTL